jgi:hypothetical protein
MPSDNCQQPDQRRCCCRHYLTFSFNSLMFCVPRYHYFCMFLPFLFSLSESTEEISGLQPWTENTTVMQEFFAKVGFKMPAIFGCE